MSASQQRSFYLGQTPSVLTSSVLEFEKSRKSNLPLPLLVRKNRVAVSLSSVRSLSNSEIETVYSVDDKAVKRFKANIYILKKLSNIKLNELADPGANRDYLTQVKVYSCFLKIGEIGKINRNVDK